MNRKIELMKQIFWSRKRVSSSRPQPWEVPAGVYYYSVLLDCLGVATAWDCLELLGVVLFWSQLWSQLLRSFTFGVTHLIELLEEIVRHIREPACGCLSNL